MGDSHFPKIDYTNYLVQYTKPLSVQFIANWQFYCLRSIPVCGQHDNKQCGQHDIKQCGEYDIKQCGQHDIKQCGQYDIKQCGQHDIKQCGQHDIKQRVPNSLPDLFCIATGNGANLSRSALRSKRCTSKKYSIANFRR
jgi:hypothetical protein